MSPRVVVAALRQFAAERAPVAVMGTLALGLSAGPWALCGGGSVSLLRTSAVVFLALVALRIVDDLRSIAHDRIAHPGRDLAEGRIPVAPLAAGAAAAFAAALTIGAPHMSALLAVLAAYYVVYYAVADRLPVAIRPVLVNVVFLAIPAVVGRGCGSDATRGLAAMGLFFWLCAVGHDYAHEVHAAHEAPAGPPTCSAVLPPRMVAVLGLFCYAGAGLVGLAAVRGIEAPLYTASLAALFVWVAGRLVLLIARPCRAAARRVYISGFACFVLPSLILGVERVVQR